MTLILGTVDSFTRENGFGRVRLDDGASLVFDSIRISRGAPVTPGSRVRLHILPKADGTPRVNAVYPLVSLANPVSVLSPEDATVVLDDAERALENNPSAILRSQLAALAEAIESMRENAPALARIDALTKRIPATALALDEPFGEAVVRDTKAAPDASIDALFAHAETATSAKPSAKWTKTAVSLFREPHAEKLAHWFALVDSPMSDHTSDVLRGLVWCSSLAPTPEMARVVGDLAIECFRKVRDIGALSTKVGNACLWTLGEMSAHGIHGVAQLGRVKARVKYPQALKLVEKALDAAAKRAKISKAELLEISVPTDDDALLPAQRARIEEMMIAPRSMALSALLERYLEHPIVSRVARRLLWQIDGRALLFDGSGFVDVEGKRVEPTGEAQLWHPIDASTSEVEAWRRRLVELEITQPFKQAHREIYVLTDAERATDTYSNRFAAHVLRQHQLAALFRERGWQYRIQGGWDTSETPSRVLPGDLVIQLEILRADDPDEDEMSHAGILLHVTSDRVRFRDARGQALSLERVPPRVFSEAMRDVDLFIGVASVGNDPEWRDNGPDNTRQYWTSYAFGELGTSAESRRAALESLVPRLRLRDRLRVDGRFLRVQGELRSYKIHIGSGNVLIEPDDQYLCIVPARAERSDVVLPFEGDAMLSIILSKAFMLAADDQIRDLSIVKQLQRR